MNRLHDVVLRVARDLERGRVRWALVGGLAVSARSEPRFTRGADLAVAVSTDAEAEAVVRNLIAVGYRVVLTLEQRAVGRLATVRLDPPESGAVVDLMFASSGIEAETVQAADALELVRDLIVPVASLGHLVALQVLARDDVSRPQDLVDLKQLLSRATEADLDAARAALALITQRGFHRGRDLAAEFSSVLDVNA